MTTYFQRKWLMIRICVLSDIIRLKTYSAVVQEEIDAPSEEFENQFAYNGAEYPARRMCEIVHAKEGTEVLSVYEQDFYAGCPVVTCNTFGKGTAYYLAAESDLAFLRAFYGRCI